MFKDSFEKKIKKGLEKLNKQQRVEFAWRCAVRALPFLGSSGAFDFWEKEKRQIHIYSVLYALDVAAAKKNLNLEPLVLD